MSKKRNSRPVATKATEKTKGDKMSRKYYNTAIKKLQVFLIIFCILLLVFGVVCSVMNMFERAQYRAIEHKVRAGETLTSIAYLYKPDDIILQDYMAWVYEHNDTGVIYPGDIVIMAEVVK